MSQDENNSLYSRLFADHPAPLWIYDPATLRFLDVNDEALREYGYTRDEFLTLTLDDIRSPEDIEASHQRINDPNRSSRERVWKHIRKDGTFLWVEISARNIGYFHPGARLTVIHVVTGRKLAEDNLRQRERQFRTLSENCPDIVSRTDRNLVCVYCNPALSVQLGVPQSELMGMKISDSPRSPEVIGLVEKSVKQVFETRKPLEVDFEHTTHYGLRKHHVHFVPEFDDTGEVETVLSMGRDITERSIIEEKLRKQEQEFRTLAENSPDIVVRYDVNLVTTYANPAYEQHTGVPTKDIVGKPFSESSRSPELVARLDEVIRSVIFTACSNDITFVADFKTGRRWHHIRFVPEFGDNGEVQSVLGIGRDITDRKAAEDSLKASEAMMRTMFDVSKATVIVVDDNHRIFDVNRSGIETMGLDRDLIVGSKIEDVMRGELGQILATALIAGENNSNAPKLLSTESPTGTRSYYNLTVSPNFLLGFHLVVLQDVTEEKQLEAQATRQDKLIAIGTLVSGIAHEINNPLAAISGTVQLLQDHPDPEVREDAATVIGMTNRIVRIVRSLIAFANPQSAERSLVDINDIVTQAMYAASGDLDAVQVNFKPLTDGTKPIVTANRDQMGNLMVNLISNAEHAMRSNAPDKRNLSLITCVAHHDGHGFVELAIEDTGIGIDPKAAEQIYDPFYTTKDIGQGTGLGLSICHAIVIAHEGTITVEPKSGPGTRVVVRLPLATAG